MSPTGSTSEQKSRTEWKVRLALALVVGVLLLMATAASAGWRTKTVPGAPNDVRVWAPGVFSVATDSGAYLDRADAGTSFINTPVEAVGSYYNPSTGCFVAYQINGNERVNPSCASESTIELTDDLRRVKSNESGAGFALLESRFSRGLSQLFKSPSSGTSLWSQLVGDVPGPPSKALGVLNMGGAEHVLLGIKRFTGANDHRLYWFSNASYVAEYGFPPAVGIPVVRDSEVVDLFPAGGATPTALYSWGNSLYRGTLVPGQNPFTPVAYPGGEGSITALDVNTGAGTTYGDGFGMATVQRDGGVTLLSAVPAAQLQDIGSEWRINPTLPAGLTAPRALECYGASFCVIARDSPLADNVYVYTNDAPPALTVSSDSPDPFTLPSGTSRLVTVRAPDPDGDAVLLRVEPSSFSQAGVSMMTTVVDGGVDISLDAGVICSDVVRSIQITATDGLDVHAMVRDYVLRAQRLAAPSAPVIAPSGIIVPAGSGTQVLRASSIAPCGIEKFTWTAVSPDAGLLVLSEAQDRRADFSPPRTVCNPLGETYVYRVLAVEDGGVSSPPTDVIIQVLPWGAPNAPFGSRLDVALEAGDSVNGSRELRPDPPVHECDRLGTGFPGVDTVWQLVDAGLPPPGVRLRADGGALITGSSAVTSALRVETDACTRAEFDLTVQHYTLGGFGDGGPESNVHVKVEPKLNPVSEATLLLDSFPASSESVAGTASVDGLNCPELRGDLGLRARISLTNDGGVVREGVFPVPGAWQFTLGTTCLGDTYGLQGELLVNGGLRGGSLPGGETGLRGPFSVVVDEPITVPAVPQPGLREMEAPFLTARCGQPATGVLEQRALPPCTELPVSWTQVGGEAALTQPSYMGQRIEVATQSTDFGELIGRSVRMNMSVKTVGTASLDQDVPILAEPFVELRRRTEKATGADVDLLGVSVELRNTTECGVRQVEHQERLEGADYVPGSARFNGAPVEAEVEGDTLTVRGMVLEGSTTGRLTYVVRPRLLESSRFEGHSFVRGVPVSRPPEEASSGCGCSGAGSGLAGLALAGLAMALRRRRKR